MIIEHSEHSSNTSHCRNKCWKSSLNSLKIQSYKKEVIISLSCTRFSLDIGSGQFWLCFWFLIMVLILVTSSVKVHDYFSITTNYFDFWNSITFEPRKSPHILLESPVFWPCFFNATLDENWRIASVDGAGGLCATAAQRMTAMHSSTGPLVSGPPFAGGTQS